MRIRVAVLCCFNSADLYCQASEQQAATAIVGLTCVHDHGTLEGVATPSVLERQCLWV
jgi:hypothetical protein